MTLLGRPAPTAADTTGRQMSSDRSSGRETVPAGRGGARVPPQQQRAVRPRSALPSPLPPRSPDLPGGASRRDRPASASWETNTDQCRRRGRSGPATAPAFSGGTYHRSPLCSCPLLTIAASSTHLPPPLQPAPSLQWCRRRAQTTAPPKRRRGGRARTIAALRVAAHTPSSRRRPRRDWGGAGPPQPCSGSAAADERGRDGDAAETGARDDGGAAKRRRGWRDADDAAPPLSPRIPPSRSMTGLALRCRGSTSSRRRQRTTDDRTGATVARDDGDAATQPRRWRDTHDFAPRPALSTPPARRRSAWRCGAGDRPPGGSSDGRRPPRRRDGGGRSRRRLRGRRGERLANAASPIHAQTWARGRGSGDRSSHCPGVGRPPARRVLDGASPSRRRVDGGCTRRRCDDRDDAATSSRRPVRSWPPPAPDELSLHSTGAPGPQPSHSSSATTSSSATSSSATSSSTCDCSAPSTSAASASATSASTTS